MFDLHVSRADTLAAVNAVPGLEKIDIGDDAIDVYRNVDMWPLFTVPKGALDLEEDVDFDDVAFKRVGPVRYELTFSTPAPATIAFAQNHHPKWRMYDGTPSWWRILVGKSRQIATTEKNDAGLITFNLMQDGLTDGKVTVYYVPQAALYLGLIISCSALVLVLAVVVVSALRNAKTLTL